MDMSVFYKPTVYTKEILFLDNKKPSDAVVEKTGNADMIFNGAVNPRDFATLDSGNASGESVLIYFPNILINPENWSKIIIDFIGVKINEENLNGTAQYVMELGLTANKNLLLTDAIYIRSLTSDKKRYVLYGYENGNRVCDGNYERWVNQYSDLGIALEKEKIMYRLYNNEGTSMEMNTMKTMYPFVRLRSTGGHITANIDGIRVRYIE